MKTWRTMCCRRRTSSRSTTGRVRVILVVEPGIHPRHHLHLLLRGGVGQDVFEHEAVGLSFREGIGAFLVHRVLRGDHQERLRNRIHPAGDRGLTLLHRLQHRALRLGAGPVDLIEQHDVRVYRAQLGDERVGRRRVHLSADDVARQQVRCALDAVKSAVNGLGDHPGGRGLGEPRNAFNQNVPTGQQADQQRLAKVLLADHLRREGIADRSDDAMGIGQLTLAELNG